MDIKKIVVQDQVKPIHLTQIQNNTEEWAKNINNSAFIRGNFVTALLITGQDNIINHGLDTEVQGWTIVDKNANSNIWKSSSVNKFPKNQIIFNVSANVTVKFYFF